MRSKGAYTSIKRIVDGSAISRIWPVAPSFEFLSGQVGTSRHSRSASANQEPYSNRTNGAIFRIVSLSFPRDQQNISAPNATVTKRSGSTLTGITIGGILASSFAVLLLLLVPCYLKRRRRRAESTRTNDMEYGHSWQSSFASRNHKALSVSHSDCLPLRDSNPVPVSQPSPKRVVFVGLPPSPSFKVKVTGERIRKPPRPARPPPLLIPPGRANREVLQGDSSEIPVPVNPPASPSSRATGERIRKPSLPTRPPPVVLHLERVVRKAPRINSNTVAKSRTITFTAEGNRDSLVNLLPNPWDSGAKPQHATFELPILPRPSFTASMIRASAFKAGLPRTPRETRTFIPPKSLIARSYAEHC